MYKPLADATLFLVRTLFELYLFILLVRLILQWVQADYYNPISQFVVKLTNPLVLPLRRIIPASHGIDFATLTCALVLEFIKLLTLIWLQFGIILPGIIGLLIWTCADLLVLLFTVYFYAILAMIILSWLMPSTYNPITNVLHLITEPLLGPARRFIPPIAGFDISPVLVLVFLKALEILIIQPLVGVGAALALTHVTIGV